MPTGESIDSEFAKTKWVIEVRRSPDLDIGRRQIRILHYGDLVCSRGDEWYSGWEYPEDSTEEAEEFYIHVTPDQLLMDYDDDIPRIDRGGNVGLWIWITDRRENGAPPNVDMFYITNPMNNDDPHRHVPRFDYDVLFASEREIVG